MTCVFLFRNKVSNMLRTTLVLSLCILSVYGDYMPSTTLYDNLHSGSTITATNDCKGYTPCEDSFTEAQCKSQGVCTLKCPSGSRTTYPGQTVLTIMTNCEDEPPTDPPSDVTSSNGHFFTNSSTNAACTENTTINSGSSIVDFGLSFWIQGKCTPECDVFRIGPEITVKIANTRLKIGTQSSSSWPEIPVDGWLHVVITKRHGGSLDLYVNKTIESLTLTVADILQGTEAVLGPRTALGSDDFYMVLDARFYDDGLTKREVDGLYDGTLPTTSDIPNCRCPVSNPVISDDGFSCSGSDTVRRLQKVFHDETVMVDGSTTTSWASRISGDVMLTVDLRNSFQISEVTVTFKATGSQPASTTSWEFKSGGQYTRIDASLYTCNITNCKINSNLGLTRSQFEKTITQEIRMTFRGRTSSGSRQSYIIEGVSISGWCDCDGTASVCTRTGAAPSYSYNCSCEQNTEDAHCRNCVNDMYRSESEFGCGSSCNCTDSGVNINDKCESVGGMCKCKANVEGIRCDACKRLYYNLQSSNPVGCTESTCDDDGSVRCNALNGTCECRPNVEGFDCDKCKDKHYNRTSKQGCFPCNCTTIGTVNAADGCNVMSGQCVCKNNTRERQCGECTDMYYGLSGSNPVGCSVCGCNPVGTDKQICNKTDGQCRCRGEDYITSFTNRQCAPVVNPPVPSFGPISGGTIVTITGQYLNNSPKIAIGGVEQDITVRSEEAITFTTANTSSLGNKTLHLTWGTLPESKQHVFDYRPNPALNRADIPKSIKASPRGGCTVTIPGTNLNSVFQPKLRVISGANISTEAVCEHVGTDGKAISCETPPVVGTARSVQLILDGIVEKDVSSMTVTEDSVLTTKNLDFAPPFEKTIKITGQKIGMDCDRTDYVVYIGAEGYGCQVTSFTATEIECEPPQDPPSGAPTGTSERMYNIVVKIGKRDFSVGEINYKQFWLTNYFVYIMVGCGLFLIAVLVIAICICCCRCRAKRRKKTKMNMNGNSGFTAINSRTSDIPLIVQEPSVKPDISPIDNPTYEPAAEDVVAVEFFLHRVEESIRKDVKDSLIGEKSFTPGITCIAKGNVARLIDGSFTPTSKIQPNQKITMKMLKEPLPERGVLSPRYVAALRECLRLKALHDDNVLSIHGIGLDKKRFYIIYPYMENRTLKDHIIDPDQNFLLRALLEFILQVAEGMEFLSSNNLVHKDLAARNCMVDVKSTVKIGDSAFSWDFYPDEYMYDRQKDRYVPVRWMAPESLKTGFYDTKSDVWSYGVLVWEILTRGILPFQELRDQDLQSYIEDGYRLGKPSMVSDDLYELMNSCWHTENEHRPTFRQIQGEVSSHLINRNSMNEDLYINSEQVTESVYINQDEIQRLRENSNPPPRRH